MLETNLFLPVVQVVSCFYNDFLACGGRSVSMIFAAKNAKIAKELGWALPRPSARFPRAAEFPIDCKRNFMV